MIAVPIGEQTVLCPTYGRPSSAARLIQGFKDTCTLDTQLIFIVEQSDPHLSEYEDVIRDSRASLLIRDQPDFPGMVAALNWGFMQLDPWLNETTHKGIGFMGDDHLPKTVGWDAAYLEALNDGGAVVWGNDLIQGEKFPTQVMLAVDIPVALGWMAPRRFRHLCIDLVWKDYGEGLGALRYLPDMIVEHLHPSAGKSDWDDGYDRANNPEVTSRDADNYYSWKEEDLPGELALLKSIWELK